MYSLCLYFKKCVYVLFGCSLQRNAFPNNIYRNTCRYLCLCVMTVKLSDELLALELKFIPVCWMEGVFLCCIKISDLNISTLSSNNKSCQIQIKLWLMSKTSLKSVVYVVCFTCFCFVLHVSILFLLLLLVLHRLFSHYIMMSSLFRWHQTLTVIC